MRNPLIGLPLGAFAIAGIFFFTDWFGHLSKAGEIFLIAWVVFTTSLTISWCILTRNKKEERG